MGEEFLVLEWVPKAMPDLVAIGELLGIEEFSGVGAHTDTMTRIQLLIFPIVPTFSMQFDLKINSSDQIIWNILDGSDIPNPCRVNRR